MKKSIPYLFALFIFPVMFGLLAYGQYDYTETLNSKIAYGQKVGDCYLYQYRIAAATTTWYSHIIPLNGAKKASLTIYEATGNLDADWAGTVGTGDFYLYGKAGDSIVFPTNTVSDEIPGATSSMILVPYYMGIKTGTNTAGQYIPGVTAIDEYGRTFYDFEEFGGLTHIQVWCTTNNTDNSVILSLQK